MANPDGGKKGSEHKPQDWGTYTMTAPDGLGPRPGARPGEGVLPRETEDPREARNPGSPPPFRRGR